MHCKDNDCFHSERIYIQRTLMHEHRETENGEKKNACMHAEKIYMRKILKHARRKNIVFANLECL